MKMTTEEAFVKTLQRHGIEHAFGIIGSAFMPISDLFPAAGITFWDCAHEGSAGMMADGYTRATGKMSMMIAQNGPGITNFVTAVKTAYWNHTPLLLVTPQAANKTIGQGGFQEVEQMALFEDMVAYQEEVRDPSRVAEVLNRVILNAKRCIRTGADQHAARFLDAGHRHRDPRAGRIRALRRAEKRRSSAGGRAAVEGEIPGDPERCRRGSGGAIGRRWRWPNVWMHRSAWAISTTTRSPDRTRCSPGPLGYNGSKAGMELIKRGGCGAVPWHTPQPVLDPAGLWHRLLAQGRQDHSGRYQPRPDRPDQESQRSGLSAMPKKVARRRFLTSCPTTAGDAGRAERKAKIAQTKSAWKQELSSLDHEDDDPGTTWNERARAAKPDWMSPRMAWRAIQSALPREAIISSDIGNNCAIGNAYPTFDEGRKYLAPGLFGPCGYGLPSIVGAKIGCPDVPVVGFAGDGAFGIAVTELTAIGRNEWPPVTMVVFRNYQWGAEKRNSTLWFEDNFVGTELDDGVSYAGIANACGLKGVVARSMDELTAALNQAIKDQMEHGITTLIEAMINQELGEPFRRDAMKKPVPVAGISEPT